VGIYKVEFKFKNSTVKNTLFIFLTHHNHHSGTNRSFPLTSWEVLALSPLSCAVCTVSMSLSGAHRGRNPFLASSLQTWGQQSVNVAVVMVRKSPGTGQPSLQLRCLWKILVLIRHLVFFLPHVPFHPNVPERITHTHTHTHTHTRSMGIENRVFCLLVKNYTTWVMPSVLSFRLFFP
jgi:hypothetical protein